jgi:ParB family chromosome partitioning protein
MALYRQGEMNLDQLTAFTVTDDHAAQERVWADLDWNKERSAILRALTESHVPASDRRFIYVGAEAYEHAGGTIIRDLFDDEHEGYAADAGLLNRLVREKLQRAAARIVAEGWKWVAVDPGFDHASAASMRRVYPALNAEDEAACKALEAERDALWEAETGDSDEEFSAKAEALEKQINAYADKEEFRPEDKMRAGAFLALGHDGKPRIERGYVRPEDMPSADEAGEPAESGKGEVRAEPALSETLLAELTAYRTSALRNTLAQDPAIAVIALTHALAAASFYHAQDASCLRITVQSAHLSRHACEIGDSAAELAISERHATWERLLPRELDSLWDFIAGLGGDERFALLAHCVALGVDAVVSKGAERNAVGHADVLARAVGLDMTPYWQPTGAAYFARVSRERIIEAVREAEGDAAARHLATLKKQPMAEAAEKLLAGKGWLPKPLRTP